MKRGIENAGKNNGANKERERRMHGRMGGKKDCMLCNIYVYMSLFYGFSVVIKLFLRIGFQKELYIHTNIYTKSMCID